MEEKLIAIVGCGPGGEAFLTGAARSAVARAEALVGSRRLLAMFPENGKERIDVGGDVAKAIAAIETRAGKRIALLVSGDTGLSSMAAPVLRRFGLAACDVIPGVSSVQYAYAKAGLDWEGGITVSAHARQPSLPGELLAAAKKVAVLAGTDDALKWAARFARANGGKRIIVCENLSMEGERVHEMTPEELENYHAPSLTVLLIIDKECL